MLCSSLGGAFLGGYAVVVGAGICYVLVCAAGLLEFTKPAEAAVSSLYCTCLLCTVKSCLVTYHR